jgi:hypothetical protein
LWLTFGIFRVRISEETPSLLTEGQSDFVSSSRKISQYYPDYTTTTSASLHFFANYLFLNRITARLAYVQSDILRPSLNNAPRLQICWEQFLGTFTKLRKATIGFGMSVCPSVRPSSWNNLTPTGWFFIKFGFWLFFLKSVDNIPIFIIITQY